jgi:hypothetical protein
MSLTLVVMAAGMGSRYGGLKQIESVGPNGEIMLEFAVFDAIRAGFDRAVFVIRHDIEEPFRQAIGRLFEGQIAVDYAYQELDMLPAGFTPPADRVKPWGTGQAILAARQHVPGPFGVINADDFYGAASFAAVAGHFSSVRLQPDPAVGELSDAEPAHCLIGFPLRETLPEEGTVSRGVCDVGDDGMLRGLDEVKRIRRAGQGIVRIDEETERPIPLGAVASMNMWGFHESIFADLERLFVGFLERDASNPASEFLLPMAVDGLVRSGRCRVRVIPTQSRWYGITNPGDKAIVAAGIAELVGRGDYPRRLW